MLRTSLSKYDYKHTLICILFFFNYYLLFKVCNMNGRYKYLFY